MLFGGFVCVRLLQDSFFIPQKSLLKRKKKVLTEVLPFQREVFESLTVTTEICLKWSEEAQIALTSVMNSSAKIYNPDKVFKM